MIKHCLDMNKIAQYMDNFQGLHSIIIFKQNHLCNMQILKYKTC